MKKILFAVMAFAAIGFTASCGNKTQQGEAVDSVALIDSLAEDAISETINALKGHVESGDASKLQETLENVKAQIIKMVKENPQLAKTCVTKLQDFLKENADKVKNVVGDNAAAQSALDAIISIDAQDGIAGIIGELGNKAGAAKDSAINAASAAKDAAAEKVSEAKDAAVDAAKQKASEAKDAAKQKASEAKDAAKQKASDAVDAAADKTKKALGL